MIDYNDIAEFLLSIGWRSPCDAQWTNLRDALPQLKEMLQVASAAPQPAQQEAATDDVFDFMKQAGMRCKSIVEGGTTFAVTLQELERFAAIAAQQEAGQARELPPLPAPTRRHYGLHYSAEDMEAYARAAQPAQSIEWTDSWNCKHTMTVEKATETLKEFFDEWPGGMEEVESVINYWKKASQKEPDEYNRKLRQRLEQEWEAVRCIKDSLAKQ